jgi:hypothetical protein
MFLVGVSGPLLDRIYPVNIFCWGKAEEDYKRIVGIREKVTWGIAIAFAISVIASFLVYYVTKP